MTSRMAILVMGNLGEIMMFIDLETMGKGTTELNSGFEKMSKNLLVGEYLLLGVGGEIKLVILLNIGNQLLGKFLVSGVYEPVGMMRKGTCLRPPPKKTRGWSTTS